MSNTPAQSIPGIVDAVYAQLNQSDIEQFYAGFQRWNLQQQITTLQTQIQTLRLQIADNTERSQEVHPSAIALATLARLQANGVSDIELLDRMLEQGELWLDRTMQRLDYCEQVDDFISDDYTQWCKFALEGAYDWIDSIQDGSLSSPAPIAITMKEPLTQATEELFLQKLSSDEEENEALVLETTHKRPAVTITYPEESAPAAEEISLPVEANSTVEADVIIEESTLESEDITLPVEVDSAVETDSIVEDSIPPSEEAPPVESTLIPEDETTAIQDLAAFAEPFSLVENATPASEQPASQEDSVHNAREDTSATDVEEPASQEYISSEEIPSIESSAISSIEQSPVQEFVEIAPITGKPSTTSPESSLQNEATVATETSAPKREKRGANVQVRAALYSGRYPQYKLAKRPNFWRRLIEKIWGS